MFEIKGKTIGDANPLVMGILNLTSDSFYESSRILELNQLTDTAHRMVLEGVDIFDLGAVSTRPGAIITDEKDELKKLLPAIRHIRKSFPELLISVDTFRSGIARAMMDEGADIINDISGGLADPQMAEIIGRNDLPYVMMHMIGTPETMQRNPLDQGVVKVVRDFLLQQLDRFYQQGASRIILDPGFGFGKTTQANYDLLLSLEELKIGQHPLLVGISRKSMIYKPLNIFPEEALYGTMALNLLALQRGASILRVHDVKQAVECKRLHALIEESRKRMKAVGSSV